MKTYLDLLQRIATHGNDRGDRTGTGTRSLFAEKMTFDLTKGLPVVTTKKVYMKGVIHELLWLLSGDTNTKYLTDNDVHIWGEWSDKQGNLGPVYGAQWRKWGEYNGGYNNGSGIDQISQVVDTLLTNPEDRRMIVNSWNVGELENMALPPCHMFFQVYSREMTVPELRKTYLKDLPDIVHMGKDELLEYINACELPTRYLDLQMYQRSADMFLGVPFNIASYAILTEMLAKQTNHIAHTYTHILGDAHIYLNHKEQVNTQLKRHTRTLPTLQLAEGVDNIFDYSYKDIKIVGYDPHPKISAPVAI